MKPEEKGIFGWVWWSELVCGLYIQKVSAGKQVVPYHDDSTASRLLSEVKHHRARLVLRWGTTLESREYYFFFQHFFVTSKSLFFILMMQKALFHIICVLTCPFEGQVDSITMWKVTFCIHLAISYPCEVLLPHSDIIGWCSN